MSNMMMSSNSSSSNSHHMMTTMGSAPVQPRAPVLASCYTSDISSTVFRSFHYSSTRAEVNFNPTTSLSGRKARQGQWASSAIQKKVNGLLCSKLALLLGLATPGLKWMDSPIINTDNNNNNNNNDNDTNKDNNGNNNNNNNNNNNISTSFLLQVSADGGVKRLDDNNKSKQNKNSTTQILEYLEVHDYIGGASFRGLIAEKKKDKKLGGGIERSLFLFFEEGVCATELKQGLVALIDLATECFDCQNLVVCLDRELEGLDSLVHDLGWVGLELFTLKHWSDTDGQRQSPDNIQDYTSEKWLLLGMEL